MKMKYPLDFNIRTSSGAMNTYFSGISRHMTRACVPHHPVAHDALGADSGKSRLVGVLARFSVTGRKDLPKPNRAVAARPAPKKTAPDDKFAQDNDVARLADKLHANA